MSPSHSIAALEVVSHVGRAHEHHISDAERTYVARRQSQKPILMNPIAENILNIIQNANITSNTLNNIKNNQSIHNFSNNYSCNNNNNLDISSACSGGESLTESANFDSLEDFYYKSVEMKVLEGIQNIVKSNADKLNSLTHEEFYYLTDISVRMGFEFVARLLIEYGHLEVSVLYNLDAWREGKSKKIQYGEQIKYKEQIDRNPTQKDTDKRETLTTLTFEKRNSTAIRRSESDISLHQELVGLQFISSNSDKINNSEYDRYGFRKHKKPNCVLNWNHVLDLKQESRIAKWKKMLKWKYPISDKTILGYYRRRKWKSRVQKGIPYLIRADCWKKMLPIDQLRHSNPGEYNRLLEIPPHPKNTKIIDCDVMRQSRDHYFFEEKFSNEMISLFNILRAYSVYDSEIGYCQGMCSIAATLLIILKDEEDSFWAFVHIMNSPLHKMRDVFLPSFPLLRESFWIHDRILDQDLSRLKKHFDTLSITSEFYSTKNYMTCFLDLFEFDTAIIIFDNFLMCGRRILFSFSRSILQLLSHELTQSSFEIILPKLQHLDTVEMDMQSLILHKRIKNSRFLELQKHYKIHKSKNS